MTAHNPLPLTETVGLCPARIDAQPFSFAESGLESALHGPEHSETVRPFADAPRVGILELARFTPGAVPNNAGSRIPNPTADICPIAARAHWQGAPVDGSFQPPSVC